MADINPDTHLDRISVKTLRAMARNAESEADQYERLAALRRNRAGIYTDVANRKERDGRA